MKLYINLIFLICVIALQGCHDSDNNTTKNKKINTDSIVKTSKVQGSNTRDSLLITSDTAIVTHKAIIKTTKGTIEIGLFGYDTPRTVNNFLELAKKGYYNGVLFHRVAKKFLIQTGDRLTLFRSRRDSWGSGGGSIYGGEFEDELNPMAPSYRLGYQIGTIAMANRGPNTNTSQFFICLDEAKALKTEWTIFGKITQGMDVVREIENVPIEPSDRDSLDGIPLDPVKIKDIKIKKILKNFKF